MSIFISYAHIDDQPLEEGQKGWIAQFHRQLEIRLTQLLGDKVEIWRDPKLTGNDVFGDAIVNQIPQAKALVSVLSPRYVKSEWCVREVATFCKAYTESGGVRVQGKSRIFKVVKTPVPLNEVPSPLDQVFNNQLGFEFYQLDAQTGRPREFADAFGAEAKRLFLEKVYDVAYDLCALLKSLAGSPNGPPAPAVASSATTEATPPGAAAALLKGTGKTVYLAFVTSDLEAQRNGIQRELLERGHTVLPNAPLPTTAAECEAAVGEHLAHCELAVHLVGGRYGLIPEEGECSVVELQNRLAAARSAQTGLARIIWLPRDVQARDERQQAFIRQLREASEAQRGAELLEDSLEKLKGLVLDKLTPPPQPLVPEAPAAVGGARRVYLISDQRDEAAVDPVEDYLFNQGLEVSRTHFDGTETEVNMAHRRNLQVCDAVLVYYGAASRAWVDTKLLDVLQAPGYGRTAPLLATVVLLAPPDDRQKQRFRTHSAEVIRLTDPGVLEPLKPFAAQLGQRPD